MCSTEEDGFLHNKFLCQDHFLSTDFMTPEGIHLISLAVPCCLDLASHSNPQASPPSNLHVLPLLPLPSELTITSCHAREPVANFRCCQPLLRHLFVPTQKVSPLPLKSLYPNLHQQQPNIFSMEDTSFFLSVVASDWEYRCLNDQNSSLKPIARHSLLKEINLAMSYLTPRK